MEQKGRDSMKRRYDYKVCPYCGSNLDVGEVCDCQKTKESRKIPGCIFYVTNSCKECVYNSEPLASVGNCTILQKHP